MSAVVKTPEAVALERAAERTPWERAVRRVAIAYVAVLAVSPAATAVLAVRDEAPAPVVDRVVRSHCSNGRIQQGIDTGRPDGLLLAKDTGIEC
ncbi:hypothetical protein [Kineosporia babensis]|uniref:Uncharacterized protein n=1 Tax=Kineosporia babensis TaxID=499548 RepID=A0A9X1NQ81_9ACTN|nr:hypothetical protein [Kineosporia babensis]MCD5317163.1 hypothetical protein [Kineosporia babensis]